MFWEVWIDFCKNHCWLWWLGVIASWTPDINWRQITREKIIVAWNEDLVHDSELLWIKFHVIVILCDPVLNLPTWWPIDTCHLKLKLVNAYLAGLKCWSKLHMDHLERFKHLKWILSVTIQWTWKLEEATRIDIHADIQQATHSQKELGHLEIWPLSVW
jgi:hypothetical protein